MSFFRVTLFFATLLGSSVYADANVTINNPSYSGYRLDWCKEWSKKCGRDAAMAYCKYKGYLKALSWTKDNNIGETKLIGTGAICRASSCDGFKTITCRKRSETFYNPMFRGYRLDWCRDWSSNCGKPAADAFCHLKGFSSSYRHSKANNIGRTRLISTGAICEASSCDGFTQIACR